MICDPCQPVSVVPESEPLNSQLTEILAALPGPTSQAGTTTLKAWIETLVSSTRAMGILGKYAQQVPDFATNGDPHMPRLAQRLLRDLQSTGTTGIVLPLCMACNEERLLVKTLPDGRRVCARCERRLVLRPCGICVKETIIVARMDGVAHCKPCWRKNPASFKQCSRCGALGGMDKRTPEGPLCPRCAPGTVLPCHSCGTVARIAGYRLGGPQCRSCFRQIKTTAQSCPGCGDKRIIAYLSPNNTPCCASCAGVPAHYACIDCGSEDNMHGKRCYTCVAKIRTLELITDKTGVINTAFEPLRHRLLQARTMTAVADFVRNRPAADLIRALVNNELPLEHTTLDQWPRPKSAEYVRSLLTASGLLPTRDENLRLFETWAKHFLQTQPPQARSVLEPYLSWNVGRNLRIKARRAPLSRNAQHYGRDKLAMAARYLEHLAASGLKLGEANQTHLETCLLEIPGRRLRTHLPAFLSWASINALMPSLTMDYNKTDNRASMMTEADYRWTVQRLETDTSIPLRLRITGLFVGLYAQRLTRITALTNDKITTDGAETRLWFGISHILAEPALADLIQQYRQETHSYRSPESTGWFFPSRNAGRHLSSSSLTRGLSQLGIDTRQLRGAALTNLAAHLPIRLLCDLTGLEAQAAVGWADIAARSWNAYPQLRSENYSNSARIE
ncbi:zinc ribbon domain-containing protein [Arthrobacter bambusae]|uniref:zinc ribbon domain-containing protein n=1 Tax=Arthrobacter bambusae TaxID=1338426 RepID=UPI001F50A66F|nr:zinc ribbon domain-containing protein [Arthrobacter bambusae]MCI0144151.1 zinc ribbon domain-containing protein [Arthrobacter bambusae]